MKSLGTDGINQRGSVRSSAGLPLYTVPVLLPAAYIPTLPYRGITTATQTHINHVQHSQKNARKHAQKHTHKTHPQNTPTKHPPKTHPQNTHKTNKNYLVKNNPYGQKTHTYFEVHTYKTKTDKRAERAARTCLHSSYEPKNTVLPGASLRTIDEKPL